MPIIRLQNVSRFSFLDKNIMYVTEDKAEQIKRHSFEAGDVVITKLGAPLGKACVVPASFGAGRIVADIVRARINEKEFSKQYVVYAINSPVCAMQLEGQTKGATRPRVNLGHIRGLQIPFPLLMNKNASSPNSTRSSPASTPPSPTSRKPSNSSRRCLRVRWRTTLLLISDCTDPTGNWKRMKVEECCTKITDGAHKTSEYVADGVPFISVKDISKGVIDFSATKFVDKETHQDLYRRCNPEFGDLLYTKVGTTGIAKVVDTEREFSLFVSVALLKPINSVINSNFFEYSLNSPSAYSQAQGRTRGVANRNLVLRDIKAIEIFVPPLEAQKRIVTKLDNLAERTRTLETETQERLDQLATLKSSLLDAAFRGKL